jgi:nicotinate-nucleotide pyrophosphorylase (carboxylating)
MTHVFSDIETQHIKTLMQIAFAEDRAGEDITSRAIFTQGERMEARIVAREKLVFAGEAVVPILLEVYAKTSISVATQDGTVLQAGDVIGTISGAAVDVLALERTLLNVLQRLCGVATLTRQFVEAVADTKAKILDTRKTIPGWRALDKYAVKCGCGHNHRMNLASEVMIKDNHIAAAGSMEEAIQRVLPLKHQGIAVVVECDTLAQVAIAMQQPISRILLDNMPPEVLAKAVALVGGAVPLEASGGVSLSTIRAIAETGVDFISVGQITHSAPAADIGLDF